MRRWVALLAGMAIVTATATACSSSSSAPTPTRTTVRALPAIPAANLTVAHPTVWLCKPGMTNNPCDGGLDTTVVQANGSTSVEPFHPAANPPIDCFYVYPTVSQANSINAPLTPEEAVIRTTRAQASRFAQTCKLYVPIYRQLTTQAILTPGKITAASLQLATTDVLSAWHDYLAHYNNGRGVVLIGHSQGSGQLKNLIGTEVDKVPAERDRLVSALLLGGNVQVPVGKDVGGDFQTVPACRRTDQTGCVVAFSSFSSTPPANALFGRVSGNAVLGGSTGNASTRQVLCVNPAALTGGSAVLHPYFPTRTLAGSFLAGIPAGILPAFPTGFVSEPGFIHAECTYTGGASWLQVNDTPAAGDTRKPLPSILPAQWGLHVEDVSLALGDLVTLVEHQAAAWPH